MSCYPCRKAFVCESKKIGGGNLRRIYWQNYGLLVDAFVLFRPFHLFYRRVRFLPEKAPRENGNEKTIIHHQHLFACPSSVAVLMSRVGGTFTPRERLGWQIRINYDLEIISLLDLPVFCRVPQGFKINQLESCILRFLFRKLNKAKVHLLVKETSALNR